MIKPMNSVYIHVWDQVRYHGICQIYIHVKEHVTKRVENEISSNLIRSIVGEIRFNICDKSWNDNK